MGRLSVGGRLRRRSFRPSFSRDAFFWIDDTLPSLLYSPPERKQYASMVATSKFPRPSSRGDDDPREIKESDIHGKQSIPCSRIDPRAKIPFQDYIRGILKVK